MASTRSRTRSLAAAVDSDADEHDLEHEKSLSHAAVSAGDRHFSQFSIRTGLEDARSLSNPAKIGVVAVFGVTLLAVLRRLRRQRLDVENAWAWTAGDATAPPNQQNLPQPLYGITVIIAENIPVEGHTTAYGAVAMPEATCSHPLVERLQQCGATLCGASRVDATPPHTAAACGTCREVGNPGHPGRLVLGDHGAACALVAAGRASMALSMDSNGGMLLSAACMGLYAMRMTQDTLQVAAKELLQPSATCCVPAVALNGTEHLLRMARALKLPGEASVPDELRVMLAADLFVMTDGVGGERVTNGIVTRSITTWLSEREHARQVELLTWLANEVSGWDEFAPAPRGEPAPEQVLLGISAAHKIIEDFEAQQSAPGDAGWLGPTWHSALEDHPPVEQKTYDTAVELRTCLRAAMKKALPPAVLMILPVLAGAAPRVRKHGVPLDDRTAAMASLSQHFMAFVAMSGCPAAVMPVPALDRKGAPWAVVMLGSPQLDAVVVRYAAKMGNHIRKTAAVIAEEQQEERRGTKKHTNGVVKPMSNAEKEAQSEEFKNRGNDAFKAGKFPDAVALYSAALELTPTSHVLYSNRAQAYITLQRFDLAKQDCDASLRCKFSVKAALRRGTACEALALWSDAVDSFRAVLQREPHNRQAKLSLRECEQALATEQEASATAAAVAADADESTML